MSRTTIETLSGLEDMSLEETKGIMGGAAASTDGGDSEDSKSGLIVVCKVNRMDIKAGEEDDGAETDEKST